MWKMAAANQRVQTFQQAQNIKQISECVCVCVCVCTLRFCSSSAYCTDQNTQKVKTEWRKKLREKNEVTARSYNKNKNAFY